MRSSRQIPHDDAMRCIALFDTLDRFGLVKFGIEHTSSQPVTYELRSSARKLWQNDPTFIDEFLAVHEQLSPEDVGYVYKWRKNIVGEFLLLKYYRECAVFRCMKTSTYYAVKALTNDFKEMLPEGAPLLLSTTLYPYKEQIVWDGIVLLKNITFGKNMRESFVADADTAKKNGKVIVQF